MAKQSWIVIRTIDGEPVLETFSEGTKTIALNTRGLYVMTALSWLGAFNRAVAMTAANELMKGAA